MSWIKRLSTTLTASMDQLVGELENHDALIRVSIREQKQRIATARLQLSRIQNSEKEVARQLAELQLAQKQWAQRALREASSDEQRALQCMERRAAVQEKLHKLQAMRTEYQSTAARISGDIQRCEEALVSMQHKHDLMRARQSSVNAKAVIDELGGSQLEQVQDQFERWELRLAQGEYTLNLQGAGDELEEQYLSEERQQALRAELDGLLAQQAAGEGGSHER